ncbi:hypothetical protein [Actinoplanes rectilineatus]|uniref:hypothetical protein n=1 Tax=Actinoplanes rectilineatus TaxID=113571 RepID=UPI00069866B7|nr:hypothetical protein [Actinoplanes rectilineatus]
MDRLARRRTAPAPAPAEPAPDWATRLRDLAGLIAPTTALTALLVYFGYIGTRARFAYFGISLDLTGLSNQNLILYALEVVYAPIALLLLTVLLLTLCHAAVTRLLQRPGTARLTTIVGLFTTAAGVLLVARACVGILVVEVSQTETPGTSALALAAGPVLITYGGWILTPGRPSRPLRYAGAVAAALMLVGLFWAANSFAAAFGQGRAYQDALDLPTEPAVLLDTKDPIAGLPPEVTETTLPGPFPHRYQGLRLLLSAGDRLFLVPAHWTAESRTLVIPYNDDVRLQLDP